MHGEIYSGLPLQTSDLYIFIWAASVEPKTGEQVPTMRLNDDLSEPTPQISLQMRPVDQVTLMTNTLPLSPCLFQTPYSCSCSPTAALQVSLPCFPSHSPEKIAALSQSWLVRCPIPGCTAMGTKQPDSTQIKYSKKSRKVTKYSSALSLQHHVHTCSILNTIWL